MSILTIYNFKGIEIKDAVLKIKRLWGSKEEGWSCLVGVYVESDLPDEEGEVLKLITEFNHYCPFSDTERGYEVMYKSLQESFGGVTYQ